ncbi:TonB-dependent hemoglobin/transferrin/lactoferrin family receptor [Kordiimonas aquimaris]|uniref:TonB-dependent hemoglobin/transferrin/lactoferrin family receptor n=1 Tax=Kordiimonas aquimaris TaxID=707591 RepID=UPI0021D25914|nr:TonB-dependent hemoglobin/transferrin/lactoferrin family receptor [Kordiimonas aquimaris]
MNFHNAIKTRSTAAKVSCLVGMSLSASALAATHALAEEAADYDGTEIEEISVTATRGESDVFTFPGAVSVISKDEIDARIAASISEIFASTPGVQFDGGPRRTGETPALRGISGEGVLVLFDGVRQNFLSGHDGRFFIEPDLLRSAEVVRGPGSALYGSSAIGGVIAFETVDARDLLGEDNQFGYRVKGGFQGANDEWLYGGTVFGQSADGAYSGLASLSFRDSSDINLARGADLQGDDEIASGLVKFSAQVSDDLKLDFSWLKFNNDAREPNNGQGISTGDLVDKDIRSETWRGGLTYNPDSDLIDLGIVAYTTRARVDEAELDTTREISRRVKTYGFVADNRSKFALGGDASVTFTYGGEYYRDEQVGLDNTTADGTRGGVPDATSETFGAFIQADFAIPTAIGGFRIIPAVRYDDFDNTSDRDASLNSSDGATSPKIGISYTPTDWLLLFGNYSEAFRAPSFNEIFADNLHFVIPAGPGVFAPNFFVPNLDLQSERAKAFEFGAGLTFEDVATDGDKLVIKGSYYDNDVTNLIDLEVNVEFSPSCFAPIPGVCTSGTSRNVNTASAEITGFEIEGQYSSDYLYLSAAYATIDGTDQDTGDFVGILTPNRLNLVGEVKMPAQSLRVGARAEFSGALTKVNDPANERRAYETVDTYLVWQPTEGPLQGLRVDMGVNNIFNANAERVFAGVPGVNRNFRTTVSWTSSF